MNTIPRPEYPRPQFQRRAWLNLNGSWQFEIDQGDSGSERGLETRDLSGTITVPFCPESELSGIGNRDFLNAVWYRRTVEIPADWAGQRVLLQFQAVDYDATVWVNGVQVVRHRGGFSPFTADLLGVAEAGSTAIIVIRARDLTRPAQPRGKQCRWYHNSGCDYTRTTGIWQTVWLEPVPHLHLTRPRITPDVAGSRFLVEATTNGTADGWKVRVILADGAGEVSSTTAPLAEGFSTTLELPVPANRRVMWAPGAGHLYSVHLELIDAAGAVVDRAESYAGLRSIAIRGKAVLINGKPVFQRLVLDQGYYADGVLTAPDDQALVRDIELSMAAGFNGARLHQKVFEERFLWHCDRLGYLVWGEFADWGAGGYGPVDDHQRQGPTYLTQWLEVLARDYSHPSIIGWCPLNETYQKLTDRITDLEDVTRGMYLATKAADRTRPVLDASGYSHLVEHPDIYDSHDYEQDPAKFRVNHAGLAQGKPFVNLTWEGNHVTNKPYRGQPYFVSEFGGIWWNPEAKPTDHSWGYGVRPKSEEEFLARFEGLVAVLLDDPNMFGYCYTQLTDVYQEQNGVYRFDRTTKVPMTRIRAAQIRPAAIEQTIPPTMGVAGA